VDGCGAEAFGTTCVTGERPAIIGTPKLLKNDTWAALSWTSAQPSGIKAETTLAFTAGDPQFKLDVQLKKPIVEAYESLHVVFPFALAQPDFLLETAGAVYRAEAEQLPDTCKDWYSIQHAVGIGNPEGGVLWGTMDAPLIQLGALQTGKWARTLDAPRGLVSSWLLNNLHFTNFQAVQEGSGRYRYQFELLAAAPDHTQVRKYGRRIQLPLQARTVPHAPGWDQGSGLSVEPATVLAEPQVDAAGEVWIKLRNIAAEPVTAKVSFTAPSDDPAVPPHWESQLRLPGYGVGQLKWQG
jgi:hypothetical protein